MGHAALKQPEMTPLEALEDGDSDAFEDFYAWLVAEHKELSDFVMSHIDEFPESKKAWAEQA